MFWSSLGCIAVLTVDRAQTNPRVKESGRKSSAEKLDEMGQPQE